MGAGKSRIGRQVAAILAWPFFDADRLVEEQTGVSIKDLFRLRGEAAFRDLEGETLLELSRKPPPVVAALGGGVVERSDNRDLLKSAFLVIWLQVDPEIAAERLGRGAGRPVLAGRAPIITLREISARREPWYREVAQLVVDANTGDPKELGQSIAAMLNPH